MLTAGAASFGSVSLGALNQAASSPLQPGTPDHRHRFIICYFSGGWDVLLGIDPRNPVNFTDEGRAQTLIQPGYSRLTNGFATEGPNGNGFYDFADSPITLGPAAGRYLAQRKYLERMCLVRGVSMNTVTHEVGRRYFLTGRVPSGLQARGSSIGTEIAAQIHGPGGAPENAQMPFVPHLAFSVEAYNDRHPSYASALKISSVNDLLSTLTRGNELGYSEIEERMIGQFLHAPESFKLPESLMPDMLRRARRSELMAEAVLAAQLDERFDFSDVGNLGSIDAIGKLASQAIINNICTVVNIRVTGSLDTHFDNWDTDQPVDQGEGWRVIAQLMDDLEGARYPDGSGDSWLDHTTIIAFSEFARTPLLNTRDGRDHHPINSCALFGAGIPGNTVIGATSDKGMNVEPVDLRTGRPDPAGVIIRPEDVLGTVMSNAGLDGSILGREIVHIPALTPNG